MAIRTEFFSRELLWRKIFSKMPQLGQSEYRSLLDSWVFAINQNLEPEDIVDAAEVAPKVNQLLYTGKELAYWSGGFDFGFNHLQMLEGAHLRVPTNCLIVLGVESDEYIRSKGREPLFSQLVRLCAAATILKQRRKLAVAFPIPPKPGGVTSRNFYNDLVYQIGMLRVPNCYHLFTRDDPHKEEKTARSLVPKSWCEMPVFGLYGQAMSVSHSLSI